MIVDIKFLDFQTINPVSLYKVNKKDESSFTIKLRDKNKQEVDLLCSVIKRGKITLVLHPNSILLNHASDELLFYYGKRKAIEKENKEIPGKIEFRGLKDKKGCFDLFFRRVPDNGGFAICAGLSQAVEFINNLEFCDDDIEFLKQNGNFSKGFLDYLKNFKFECDVYAIPEGTPVFAKEPVLKVVGPIIQATLIETVLLISINHQTLIATKANRVARAAQGKEVVELGVRRAHGTDAALNGARAAYIGGCVASGCTIVNK